MLISVLSKPYVPSKLICYRKIMKMLKIKDDTHKELTSVLGDLTSRNGEIKTYDDVLKELLQAYKKKAKS